MGIVGLQGFVKLAASRTVHLQEYQLREIPLYYYYSNEFMCPPFPYATPSSPFCFHYSLLY